MIYDDPAAFDAYDRSDMEQLRRFLSSRNAPIDAYRLAPTGRPVLADVDANATLVATYASDRFRNGNPLGWVNWPTPSGRAEIRTDRRMAEFIIAFAFDRPENLSMLIEIPASTSVEEAVVLLGLESDVLVRSVAKYRPGAYISPDGTGWTYFLVEEYGDIIILADGAQATPLLQMLASNNRMQEQNLAGRMAEFMVPINPEDQDGM